jgi:arginine N-succinyltransferase
MYYEGYVDIFDAGPVLQARVSELRAMRDSTLADIGPATDWDSACAPESVAAEPMLVSNTTLKDFRMILSQSVPVNGAIALPEAEQKLLRCQSGDSVRTLTLNPRKNHG